MADDFKQLLEELKEIMSGLKDFGQYAKDISAAMNTATRPMQQMSDYMKAISEQSRKTEESMEGILTDLGDMLVKTTDQKKVSEELNQLKIKNVELDNQRLELVNKEKAIHLENSTIYQAQNAERAKLNAALADSGGIFQRMANSTKEWYEDLLKAGYTIDKSTGQAKELEGVMGKLARTKAKIYGGGSEAMFGADPQGAVKQITGGLSSLAPTAGLGGLMGMMIYGKMEEAKFNAVGQKAAQAFDTVGGHAKGFAGQMGELARSLSKNGYATAESLQAVSKNLSDTGITAKEASASIGKFSDGMGGSLMVATLRADKAFEMAEGTMASLAGTMSKDFNMAADESFTRLINIGTAARDAGMNASVMMQQVMEASSSLRLMNANAGEAMQTQLAFAKSMKGVRGAFAAEYAQAGMTSVNQAMSGGMNEGVMAILGQRMFGGDALDALYKIKSPLARQDAGGPEKLDWKEMFGQMQGMFQEQGVEGTGAKYKWLESVFGVNTAGADIILRAQKEQQETGGLSKETQKALGDAFKTESQKTSSILLDIKNIEDGFAKLSVGLLGMIVNGIKLLTNLVGMGIGKMPGTGAWGDRMFETSLKGFNEAQAGASAGAGQFMTGVAQIGSHSGNLLKTFLGSGSFIGSGIDPNEKPENKISNQQAWEQAAALQKSYYNSTMDPQSAKTAMAEWIRKTNSGSGTDHWNVDTLDENGQRVQIEVSVKGLRQAGSSKSMGISKVQKD